jgi:hypothetical protein
VAFEVGLQNDEPIHQLPAGEPALKGQVTLTLSDEDPLIGYNAELSPQSMVDLHYLRGAWLRVGAESFGTSRDDCIFPGIEWLVDDEWSSGTDWFEHPEALRVSPHPHKVAIPIMAISHGGVGLGVSWDPQQGALSHMTRFRCPQPVLASPNFIDRRNHHLLGLMIPSGRWGMMENELRADPPVRVPRGIKLALDAEISVVQGTSLDVVVDWVRRKGLPDPGMPRYQWTEVLDRIARAFNTNLWMDGKGWGFTGQGSRAVPGLVTQYIEQGADREVAEGLVEKVEWCRANRAPPGKASPGPTRIGLMSDQDMRRMADGLLGIQTPDGDFPFDPDGRHRTDLLERAALWRPLGVAGDSAVDLCATASAMLLLAGRKLGEKRFLDGARKTLESAYKSDRPEGGDWWETPLHSPNLLAAGNAAIAYYLGYEEFGDQRYLARAVHWIRSLLPFTHLWEPDDMPMVYNTKPCLNTTCWYLSDWTAKHVQWEVLTVFEMSDNLGIDWAEIDPEVDWSTYHRGVTTAVLRWMIDHEDAEWMFRSEFQSDAVKRGDWDALFVDTFDPVADTYGGGPIMPNEECPWRGSRQALNLASTRTQTALAASRLILMA